METQRRLEDTNVLGYLRDAGLWAPGEAGRVEPAGDGNINWVRRVRGPAGHAVVVKQARPALERFPEYRVSTARIVFEARYFEQTARFDAEQVRPRVLHFDPVARVLVLEDLGDVPRLDHALARGDDVSDALCRLLRFLGAVHAGTRTQAATLAKRFGNQEMQRLHGDHVFHLPFRENDFALSPALRARAEALWRDHALVATIDAAYARYLTARVALVHGDVQAGNVLLAARGPVLLDAEIAHAGDPAFDVGVLLGHVLAHGIARGEPAGARALARHSWRAYAAAAGPAAPRFEEVARHAGIELLRRTVGAARLACVEGDAAGLAVVDAALALVREPPAAP